MKKKQNSRHNAENDAGFLSDPEETVDLQHAADDFLMENQADADAFDFDLKEPELRRDEFIDGKLVRPGRRRKLLLSVAGALGVVFTAVIITLTLLQKSRHTARGWYAAHTQQPTVLISTQGLESFVPGLQPERLIPGLDIELKDNGRRVAPGRYTVQGFHAPVRLVLCLDGISDKNRIAEILQRINRLHPGGVNSRYRKNFAIWIPGKDGYGAVKLLSSTSTLSLNSLLKQIPTAPSRGNLLESVLLYYARKAKETRQILYISGAPLPGRSAYNSEAVYTLLKKNRLFQIYHLRTAENTPVHSRDPFVYLSSNPADFSRRAVELQWFNSSDTRWDKKLEAALSDAVPLEKIEISYKPDRKQLEIDGKNASRLRSLKIEFRRSERESRLTALPERYYWPVSYPFRLPLTVSYPLKEEAAYINGVRVSTNRILAGFDPALSGLEVKLYKTAAAIRGIPLAVLTNGTVIYRISGQIPRDKIIRRSRELHRSGIADFVCYEPLFLRSVSENKLPELQSDTVSQQKTVQNRLITGLAWNIPNFPAEHFTAVNRITSVSNITPSHRLRFSGKIRAVSGIRHHGAAITTGAQETERVAAPGFEVLSLLQTVLASPEDKQGPLFVLIDHNGIDETHWPEAGSLRQILRSRLKQSAQRKTVWLIPPESVSKRKTTVPSNLFCALPSGKRSVAPRHWESALSHQAAVAAVQSPDPQTALWKLWEALAVTADAFPSKDFSFFAEVIRHAASDRGKISGIPAPHSYGVLSWQRLIAVIEHRKTVAEGMLKFNDLSRHSYSDVDQALFGALHSELDSISMITPIPQTSRGPWYKTYQYFDRSILYTGKKSGDALYNMHTRFSVTAADRQELALVSYRGSLFLFCTRNRHRGWICNLQSPPAPALINGTGNLQFDQDDNLVFVLTARGELTAFDMQRGLLQNWQVSAADAGIPAVPAFVTDHGTGNGILLVDGKNNNLWIFGSGSNRLLRIKYRREADTLQISLAPDDVSKTVLFQEQSNRPPPNLSKLFSNPVLFDNGTLNLIRNRISAEEPAVYYRFDKDGTRLL